MGDFENGIIRVKLEPEDFIGINRAMLRSKRNVNKYLKGLTFYIILFFIVTIATAFLGTFKPTKTQPNEVNNEVVNNSIPFFISYIPILLLVVICISLILLIPYINKRAAQKHYDSNKQLHKEIEYLFNNNGIEVHSESTYSKYTWDEIFKIAESKKAFAIFQSNVTAMVIPKRCFIENGSIDSLRALLKSKIPNKKYEMLKK